MSNVNVKVSEVTREGSVTAKAFSLIKDGKVHKLSAVRAVIKKAKVKRQLSLLFRLGRILRRHTDKTIVFDYDKDTIQMVTNKKGTSKSKPTAKTTKKHKKVVAKKAPAKVAVAAGVDLDEE